MYIEIEISEMKHTLIQADREFKAWHTNINPLRQYEIWKTVEQTITFIGILVVVTMLGNSISYVSHDGVVIMLGEAIYKGGK
jgi:hypothetical protein